MHSSDTGDVCTHLCLEAVLCSHNCLAHAAKGVCSRINSMSRMLLGQSLQNSHVGCASMVSMLNVSLSSQHAVQPLYAPHIRVAKGVYKNSGYGFDAGRR